MNARLSAYAAVPLVAGALLIYFGFYRAMSLVKTFDIARVLQDTSIRDPASIAYVLISANSTLGFFYAGCRLVARTAGALTFTICAVEILRAPYVIVYLYVVHESGSLAPGFTTILSFSAALAGVLLSLRARLYKPAPFRTEAPENWRESLVTSLCDNGIVRPDDGAHGSMMSLLGYFAITGGALILASLIPSDSPWLLIAWVVFSIAVLARLRNMFLRSFWRKRARTAVQELLLGHGRHPVLYLRSFGIDQKIAAPSLVEHMLGIVPIHSSEQILAREMREIGPVIAIGRPGEPLPELGAARFYVSDEKWKEKVTDVVRVADLVVWVTGNTEGLRWELAHLIETLPPERLMLWAHPYLYGYRRAERESEWEQFRAGLGTILRRPLPARLDDARFFYFTAAGNPIPVRPTWFGGGQRSALRALLRQNGYPRDNWRRKSDWIAAAATVALAAAYFGWSLLSAWRELQS